MRHLLRVLDAARWVLRVGWVLVERVRYTRQGRTQTLEVWYDAATGHTRRLSWRS